MTALVYTLGVVLFLIGIIGSIGLHEVGHMAPAKLFGVKVTQYFVGFGKTMWSVKRGDTEYGVKAIPMGGFIRMVGMLPPAKHHPDGSVRGISGGFFGKLIADARTAEHKQLMETPDDRLFYRKPWWQKVIIMAGGPTVNLVIAVLLLGGVFMGIGTSEPTLTVDKVSDCVIAATPGAQEERACTASDPVAPARKAGFDPGDQIVSFNGVPIGDWDQFTDEVRANGRGLATVVVRRDGRDVTLTTHTTISPRLVGDNFDQIANVGFLGVTPTEAYVRHDLGYVVSTMGDYTKHTGEALVQLPQRMYGVFEAAFGLADRQQNSPMSVVGASRVAGDIASTDQLTVKDRAAYLLSLLGIVNLFVALFNFIPLLPLDGGHIAGALYEAVRRGMARLRRRPDPGYADVAQMLPIAYTAATVLIVMGAMLVWADIVSPIKPTG
jgi:membrane-associated protease RseP (regulator of RpoE activity)